MKFFILVIKGLIYDMAMRRKIMGGCLLVALAMMLAGMTLFARWLREQPWLFIGFWLLCTWLTVLAMLLAVYDMLMIRAIARRERLLLKKKIFAAEELREPHSGNGHHPDI